MDIEVRSSTNTAPVYGNPKADCKGVKEAMGLPSSVDPFPPITLGVLTSTPGDEGGVTLLDSRGLSDLLYAFVSGFFVCKASLFCGGLSISYGTFSGLRFFCASCSKPRGKFSCSWGRVIASPCSTLGRPLSLCF
jgi:hypothetical protein